MTDTEQRETGETKQEDIPKVKFSELERVVVKADIGLMQMLAEEFNKARPELDGMNRTQYYESNRKKDLSYIPPKKNKQDTRIVTGTTREKDTTLLSTLLNLNVVPDVTAFDEEDMVVAELGDNTSDLVKKSREIEDWLKKRPIIYREMISQGDVFVEEVYIDDFRKVPLTKVEWDPIKDGVSKLSFDERLKKIYSGCSSRMVKGNKMYLGDMSIEYIDDQDIVAVCTIMSRTKGEAMYGEWERWKNVPKQIEVTGEFQFTEGLYSKNWSMFNTRIDQISEVKLFKKSQNRFQIYINGIPMLPVNYPMTALYPSGELPFAQGKLEPISGFALSKSQPSKTKVDQEVIDEITTLMIEGMRQSRKPPMGTTGKRVYGQNIFLAGTLTPDVKKDTFHSLLPDRALGISPGDFGFYNLIKESINEKTVNEVFSGEGQENIDTLGQAELMQQQQMLKLGSAIDGMTNLERRMTWNRIHNIYFNWTLPIDSSLEKSREGILETLNSYRKLSVETTLENGEPGIKVFRFSDREFPLTHDIYEEEEKLTKVQGKGVRLAYMNPKKLRDMRFKWFIIINPTPKSNDKLSQLLFVQNVQTAIEIFGPESLNLEYVKQRYAIMINEDYTKFFRQMDIMTMLQQGLEGSIGGNDNNSQPTPERKKTNARKPALVVG